MNRSLYIKNRVKKLESMRSKVKTLTADVKTVQAELVQALRDNDSKDVEFDDNDNTFIATLVEPVRTSIDYEKLRDVLTMAQWNAITVRTVDKELLEAAIKAKKIDPKAVAKVSKTEPTTAYVKVTKV